MGGNNCCSVCEEKLYTLYVLQDYTEKYHEEVPEVDNPEEMDENVEINHVELFVSKKSNLAGLSAFSHVTESPKQVPDIQIIKEKSGSDESIMNQIDEMGQIMPEKHLEEKMDFLMPLENKKSFLSGFRAESDWQISSGLKKVVDVRPHHFRRENKMELHNNYEILENIGKGAFGEVKKIKDKNSGQMRAMKIIPKEKCEATSTFAEEIKILQTIDHPNVLRLYEFYQDAENYYLITEFCRGGDLLNKINLLVRIPEIQAAKIMRQLLSAVDCCHRQNIVHRDIKPENIVFEEETISSLLKVIDFGRSKILRHKVHLKELAGSMLYMAPEVLEEKEYDEKCDIWSCGVIMYLLLCGSPPYSGKSREDLINIEKKGQINYSHPIWKKVSPECIDLLELLLTYDPEKRISSSAALRHKWISKFFKQGIVQVAGLRRVINNLKTYKVGMVLQQAVLSYFASQLLSKEEEKKIRLLYNYLDVDQDGQISKKDLIQGFTKIYKDLSKAKKEAEAIMKNVNFNEHMCIGYNEFLVANLAEKGQISDESLRLAFRFFDEDGKGYIDINDLRRVFGTKHSNETLQRIIDETDEDNDKKINYSDFQSMMRSLHGDKCNVLGGTTHTDLAIFDTQSD